MNLYVDNLPEDVARQHAERYQRAFEMFLRHKDVIGRVTLWGTDDGSSWLNDFPVRGRTDYPLLFDRQRQPKPAFFAVRRPHRRHADGRPHLNWRISLAARNKLWKLFAVAAAALCMGVSAPLGPARAASRPAPPPRTIAVDYAQAKGPTSQVYRQCIGAGRANEGLRADWQRQLAFAQRKCGFQYIRMHGLFTDDMGVYSEDKAGHPVYNWQYVDRLYDFLLSIHVRPFVELGFMPGALASGRQTIFWWRGNVTPPKDYDKWHDLVAAATRHWTERYGQAEVKNWYFEVWNEPNLKGGFWTGDQQDYFKLYSASATAVKSVSPQYRVGGPATAGNGWITDFIRYCADNHTPVDFVSTHTYGVGQGFLDADGSRGTVVSRDPNAVSGDMRRTRAEIDVSPLPRLPLYLHRVERLLHAGRPHPRQLR